MNDIYHQRYLYEKNFKYNKFINLENIRYTEHTDLGCINMVIQTYPINKFEKLEEMILCLHNNLNNKCIKKIYNLYEDNIDFLPEYIKNNNKLINIKIKKNEDEYCYTHIPDFSKSFDLIIKYYKNSNIDENTDKSIFINNLKNRLTWKYFIKFCIETFNNDDVICLANSDIIIEDSFEWFSVSDFLNNNKVLCLSRHEIDKRGDVFIDFNTFKNLSQDCWVLKKNDLINNLIIDLDFSIGNCMCCDNVIAEIFINNNYLPLNYSFKYRIFHLDRVTKINNEICLTKTHDNRLIEHSDNITILNICPFLNYEELLKLPNELINIGKITYTFYSNV